MFRFAQHDSAVYGWVLRNKFADERFLFLQLCYGRVDFLAAEIIYRKALHDFPFSAAHTDRE